MPENAANSIATKTPSSSFSFLLRPSCPNTGMDFHHVDMGTAGSARDAIETDQAQRPEPLASPRGWHWWFLAILHIFFLLAGQIAAVLLERFYYDQGGNSKWISTIVQTSYGLLYLPVSTYSLVCATQLAFNAIFSYYLNSQKFTGYILNYVVLLTFSAALLGCNEDAEGSTDVSARKFGLGFILTLGASATYSLVLSLMQFIFEKVIRRETFSVVLEMQIYTSLVATCASIVGLFISGEWKSLTSEMEGYAKGKVSYVMTLIMTGLSWQLASVGVVGLVFVVSSLFSNVISTLALPIVPIFAVFFFHDKINGIKIIAMLIAFWGFASYIYQNYLDDRKAKRATHVQLSDREHE